MTLRHLIASMFPHLSAEHVVPDSPKDVNYNCVAWALGRNDQWIWPFPSGPWPRAWPDGVPEEETVEAFSLLLAHYGWQPVAGSVYENFDPLLADQLLLYVHDGSVRHIARYLGDGWWTSKLADFVDIRHRGLNSLQGDAYGLPELLYRRM